MKLTLNVGCGNRTFKYYPSRSNLCINLDFRVIEGATGLAADVRRLPFGDETFDYILASDIIEHFPIAETQSVLAEWRRVLKPGCVIEFRLPNLEAITEDYVIRKSDNRKDGSPMSEYFSWLLYGGQDYSGNFHYVAFDRRSFKYECGKAGFKQVYWAKEGYNMIVKMEKENA